MTVSAATTASSPSSSAPPLRLSQRLPGQRLPGRRTRVLDGGWWPHSINPNVELPGLVIAINASRGVVTQVTLHPDAWDPMPDGLTLDGRAVRLDWDQNLDPHAIILTFGENERLHLLVVPPQARMRRAAAAMAAAEESGNGLQASELLRQLSILPSSGESVEGHSQGGAP